MHPRPCCRPTLTGLLSLLVAADVSLRPGSTAPPPHFPPVYAPAPVLREAALAVESMIAACSVLQPQRLSASSVAALLDWADEGVSSWPHDGGRRGRACAYLVCMLGSPVFSCLRCWRARDAPKLVVASLPQVLL